MNNIVKVAVTRNQLEKIRQMAEADSLSVSAFARQRILNQNYMLEKMIIEIHKEIVENGR